MSYTSLFGVVFFLVFSFSTLISFTFFEELDFDYDSGDSLNFVFSKTPEIVENRNEGFGAESSIEHRHSGIFGSGSSLSEILITRFDGYLGEESLPEGEVQVEEQHHALESLSVSDKVYLHLEEDGGHMDFCLTVFKLLHLQEQDGHPRRWQHVIKRYKKPTMGFFDQDEGDFFAVSGQRRQIDFEHVEDWKLLYEDTVPGRVDVFAHSADDRFVAVNYHMHINQVADSGETYIDVTYRIRVYEFISRDDARIYDFKLLSNQPLTSLAISEHHIVYATEDDSQVFRTVSLSALRNGDSGTIDLESLSDSRTEFSSVRYGPGRGLKTTTEPRTTPYLWPQSFTSLMMPLPATPGKTIRVLTVESGTDYMQYSHSGHIYALNDRNEWFVEYSFADTSFSRKAHIDDRRPILPTVGTSLNNDYIAVSTTPYIVILDEHKLSPPIEIINLSPGTVFRKMTLNSMGNMLAILDSLDNIIVLSREVPPIGYPHEEEYVQWNVKMEFRMPSEFKGLVLLDILLVNSKDLSHELTKDYDFEGLDYNSLNFLILMFTNGVISVVDVSEDIFVDDFFSLFDYWEVVIGLIFVSTYLLCTARVRGFRRRRQRQNANNAGQAAPQNPPRDARSNVSNVSRVFLRRRRVDSNQPRPAHEERKEFKEEKLAHAAQVAAQYFGGSRESDSRRRFRKDNMEGTNQSRDSEGEVKGDEQDPQRNLRRRVVRGKRQRKDVDSNEPVSSERFVPVPPARAWGERRAESVSLGNEQRTNASVESQRREGDGEMD